MANTLTGTYTALTGWGALQVTLTPTEAVTAGARWQVSGGAWNESAATVDSLSVGAHVIAYRAATGYTAPTSETTSILSGQTRILSRAYTATPTATTTARPANRLANIPYPFGFKSLDEVRDYLIKLRSKLSGTDFTVTMNDIVSTTGGSGLPEPTLGAIIYGNATPKWDVLPGQITTTKKVLTQTGIGTVSAPPQWEQYAGVPLDGVLYEMLTCNAENLVWGWPGTGNTFVGEDVAGSRTSGQYDSIFGFEAGHSITSGTANSVFGYQAQHSKTSGSFCNAFGYQTQYSLTTSATNNAFGSRAQYSLTTGDSNNAFGDGAQYYLTTGSSNVAFGHMAQGAQDGFMTGGSNCAFGTTAQAALTTGGNNSAFGCSSQASLTIGSNNSSFGLSANDNLTTGNNNTALGCLAGNAVTTTDGGVFLGYKAGYYETVVDKLFIDNRQRTSEADGRIKALVYGVFADAVANQSLTFNANVSIAGTLTLATPLAPSGAKYIVQEVDATLTNEQSLGALGNGLLLNTTTASVGVLSIATDIPTAVTIGGAYVYRVSGTDVAVADGGTGVSTLALNGILFGNAANAVGITAIGVQYNILTVGASPFVPAWSGYLLSGTTGGKTTFAVTNAKTLTLTATDDYNLTVAATASISGTNTGDNSANSLYDIGSDTQAYSAILDAIAAGTWTGASSITTLGTVGTGSWHATTIDVDHGGTGATTLADGGIVIGNATAAVEVVAAGTTLQILVGGGAATAPVWGTDIPTAVTIGSAYIYRASGTDVPVADGGTGLSAGTSGGILGYTASGTLASSAALTDSILLVGGGAGATPTSLVSGLGATTQYLRGNAGGEATWATLNQAAVAGLTTADGPSFDHLHLTAGGSAGTLFAAGDIIIDYDGGSSMTAKGHGGAAFQLYDYHGAADGKMWRFTCAGTVGGIDLVNDAYSAATSAIQVTRSGTTVVRIDLGGPTCIKTPGGYCMAWGATGICAAGTGYVVIPDGAGDVTAGCRITYNAISSSGTYSGSVVNVLTGGSDASFLTDSAGNIWKFRVVANGTLDIYKSTVIDAKTLTVNLLITWL